MYVSPHCCRTFLCSSKLVSVSIQEKAFVFFKTVLNYELQQQKIVIVLVILNLRSLTHAHTLTHMCAKQIQTRACMLLRSSLSKQ